MAHSTIERWVPTQTEQWLPTQAAAYLLGCTGEHLRRKRDTHGGYFLAGVHYCLGGGRTAPISWNVERCREAMHQQGLKARMPAKPSSSEE
jgi:hypothetical protein